MNIKDLKKLIENLPDDLPILVGDYDHSYRKAGCYVLDVEYVSKLKKYFEYYDERNMSPDGEIKKGLVIE